MSFKGIDIRSSGDRVIVRASLKDSAGARVTTGTTTVTIAELQSDASLGKTFDFVTNTFKASGMTTGGSTSTLTHRTVLGDADAAVSTGIWTKAITTVTGFTRGGMYVAIVSNASASPPQQEREFQYGDGEGDLSVDTFGEAAANVTGWNNTTVSGTYAQDCQGVVALAGGANTKAGTIQTTTSNTNTAVNAIKAKTDQFVFSVAGKVDANALAIGTGVITAAAVAAGALNGKGDWLTGLGATAPAGWITAATLAAAALNGKGDWLLATSYTAPDNASAATAATQAAAANTAAAAVKTTTDKLATMINASNQFTASALANAPAGGGGGSGGVAGPGASQCTLTVTRPDNVTPIADADVWLTTTAGSPTPAVAGTLQTDSNGRVTFLLDAGATYYLWCQKDGEEPIRGQSFVAVAD